MPKTIRKELNLKIDDSDPCHVKVMLGSLHLATIHAYGDDAHITEKHDGNIYDALRSGTPEQRIELALDRLAPILEAAE